MNVTMDDLSFDRHNDIVQLKGRYYGLSFVLNGTSQLYRDHPPEIAKQVLELVKAHVVAQKMVS